MSLASFGNVLRLLSVAGGGAGGLCALSLAMCTNLSGKNIAHVIHDMDRQWMHRRAHIHT